MKPSLCARVARRTVLDDADGIVVSRLLHSERRENVFLQKVGVRFAGRAFDNRAEQVVTGVAVSVFFTERELERLISEPIGQFGGGRLRRRGLREIGKLRVVRNAGSVRQ